MPDTREDNLNEELRHDPTSVSHAELCEIVAQMLEREHLKAIRRVTPAIDLSEIILLQDY
jgi:hypothetical protein